jgi:hypothetical protein
MKIFKRYLFISFTICLCTFLWTGGLKADEIEILEKLSFSIEKSLDSLQTSRSRLVKEGEFVATQLDILRTKELLSPKEHHQMEKLLQKSQALGLQMEGINQSISNAKRRYDENIEKIVDAYRLKLSEIRRSVENAGPSEKSRLLGQMQWLLEKKNTWEFKLSSSTSAVPQSINIELQPWNNREEIRLKGDMLMDEAEAVRDEIQKIEQRIRSLREEREVRRNVSELSKELALFNEHDELIGRHMAALNPDGGKINEALYGEKDVRNTGEPAGPGIEEIFLPNQPQKQGASAALNPSDLNNQISILQQYKKRLVVRADSLEQKASWFYKKAKDKQD